MHAIDRPPGERKPLTYVIAVADGDCVQQGCQHRAEENKVSPDRIALNCARGEVAQPDALRGGFPLASHVGDGAGFVTFIGVEEILEGQALRPRLSYDR